LRFTNLTISAFFINGCQLLSLNFTYFSSMDQYRCPKFPYWLILCNNVILQWHYTNPSSYSINGQILKA
jgi:hypothetical protein